MDNRKALGSEMESVYIMPGNLSVMTRKQRFGRYGFPLCHYHGISISIDINAAPECHSCFLEDVNVRPKELAKRLCGKEKIISSIFFRAVLGAGRLQKGNCF